MPFLFSLLAKLFAIAVSLMSIAAYSAENDVFLTIQGNLIDRAELLDENSSADHVISTYYELLPLDANADISTRRNQLERLHPAYEVAYLAADSAEMAEIREKIDEQWAVIQSIHRYFFTAQVVEILNQAYIENFDGLLPEENETSN